LGARLAEAYRKLVKGFSRGGGYCAAAGAGVPGGIKAASFAQNLWRFLSNQRVRGWHLIEPLLARIRVESEVEAVAVQGGGDDDDGRPILLAVHDWSTVHFDHRSKADRATLTHAADVGYDLKTTLIVRARDGAPIAPAEVALRTADAVHSTREGESPPHAPHVDQLLDAMDHARSLGLAATLVHVVDR